MGNKPTVLAFLGRAGSGKSTAAKHVIDTEGAQKVSFAGPLKELARLLMEFDDEQLYGSQAAKEAVDPRYGMSSRTFLQRLGHGAREIIGKNVWVDALVNTIMSSYEKNPENSLFVTDDCRHLNEAELIANSDAWNGFVVKLECPDADSAADATHPSESEVDLVPSAHIARKIVSERSPGSADLLRQIDAVLAELGIGKRT